MHSTHFRICLALAFALLVANTLVAQPAFEEFPQGLLDREAVMQSAAEVSREVYPNADAVLVDDYIWIRYRKDGTSVAWDDAYEKVLTEKGKRQAQSMSFRFTLPYGTTTVTLIEIIRPDGTVVPIDIEAQSKVMVDPSQQSSNIYNPNSKVLQIGVPGVEIGDVVHYVFRRDIVKPRVPDTWSDWQTFESHSPFKHYIYEVRSPKDLPLESIALKDPVEGTVTFAQSEEGENIVYRWEAGNIPRIYEEPSMPSYWTVVQRLLVSTIPDWHDLSIWYWNLSEPHFATTPAIREKVAEVTKGVTDRTEKIESIFYWVSQEIRYMGITVEDDAPGYEPHDASMTFENRHGVCRDKAALLVAMLREADLPAYPVLINNGPKKDVEVPQPYFNHAIVAVDDPDGGYILMDPTDENTKQLFPAYLCDQSYLVAKPEGETLLVSEIIPAEDNLMRITTRGTVDAEGNLRCDSQLIFDGINDNAYRGYFSRLKPEERRQYFEGVVKRLAAGARLTAFELRPADMLDTSTTLAVDLTFEADNILVSNDDTVMLPVPFVGARVGMVNFILRGTGLKKRKYPLETDIACGVRETLEIVLDPALGQVVAMPDYPEIVDETVTWKQALQAADGAITGSSEFLMKGVEFDPKQYLALKETLKTLEYNARKMPILSREGAQAAEADIVLLDSEYTYDLTDAHNWTVTRKAKKKILTYKGKKENSELHISFNPVWEEVELLRATVTNGDAVKEISDEEQNLMDAGWVAGAPRYPGAKTLVASLPGVEIGSIIEYEIKRTAKNRPFFSANQNFRSSDPLEHKRLTLRTPKGLEMKILTANYGLAALDAPPDAPAVFDVEETERGGIVERMWTVVDQTARKPERSLPPWWSFNPTVTLSTGDWKVYARNVRKVLIRAAKKQGETTARAKETVKGIKDKTDKIIAVRDFVAKSIRSAGPGIHALPLSAVTPADQTLSDAYGNSTDRAVLLYAMLRATGFRPEFVLASYAPLLPELRDPLLEIPDPSTFSNVLVRVRLGKEYIYLGDTNQYAALGATAHDQYAGLVLRTGRIETIRSTVERLDFSEQLYELEVAENGDTRIKTTTLVRGNAFAGSHRQFAEMPPEERDRYFQEAVAGISQAAEAESDLITDFDSYPGVIEFTVEAKQYAVRDGDYLYFRLPGSLNNLLGLRSDERENPLYWGDETNSVIRTTVRLPKGYTPVLTPGQIAWDAPSDGGSVRVEESLDGDYTIAHTAALRPAAIPADAYPGLLEINRNLSHVAACMVLLRKAE